MKIMQNLSSRLLLGAPLFLITLLSACSPVDSIKPFDNEQAARVLQQNYTAHPTKNRIAVTLPNRSQWKRVDLSFGTIGSPMMLVPANEDLSNWTQSIRTKIVDSYHFPEMTAKQFADIQIGWAKEHCAASSGTIVENTPGYSFYRLTMASCHGEKDQTQVGKAFNGKDGVYLVLYSAEQGRVDAATAAKMEKVIRQAKLV
jgi:hypothetical protein